jgi:hypothetical protein
MVDLTVAATPSVRHSSCPEETGGLTVAATPSVRHSSCPEETSWQG